MTLNSTLDILYLVSAVAIAWIAVFLCWALYEVAKMLHQANAVVTDAREKLGRLEKAVMSSAHYLGMLAEGGKSLLSFLHLTEEKKEKRRSKKHTDEEEE